MKNNRALNVLKYHSMTRNPIFPLIYWGVCDDLTLEDGRICEFWQGVAGDRVYHFHLPYPNPELNLGSIGKPINIPDDEIDPGYVFLFLRATNPVWHKPVILSVMDQIRDAIIYIGNSSNLPKGGNPRFQLIPAELYNLHETLKSLNGKEHKAAFVTIPNAGDRFLAKLALGFGALFLEESFISSPQADRLRNLLWSQDPTLREQLNIPGSSFFAEKTSYTDQMKEYMGWKPGHVILMKPSPPQLGLKIALYGSQVADIEITSDATHWKGKINVDGDVYLVAPGLRKHYGPIELPKYICAKIERDVDAAPELCRFLLEAENPPPLPPLHLPERSTENQPE